VAIVPDHTWHPQHYAFTTLLRTPKYRPRVSTMSLAYFSMVP
jgi:hypothetical protein